MSEVTLAARHIAVEGPIGVGKTSLICAIAERLEGITGAGFYTEETRQS